jgi:glucose-1-phosphate adenylyltransferase
MHITQGYQVFACSSINSYTLSLELYLRTPHFWTILSPTFLKETMFLTSMDTTNVSVFIPAGGVGLRLYPLTRDRAKPAVPYLDAYRIIDFVMSNLIHSGFLDLHILTQHKDASLTRHAENGFCPLIGKTIDELMLPAAADTINGLYRGTADAIQKNLHVIEDKRPEHIFIFNSDHIYVMDVREMHRFHLEHDADLTIAANRVPVAEAARNFGVLSVDDSGRVIGFEEKPAHPKEIPGDPGFCLASMGNMDWKSLALVEDLLVDSRKQYTIDTTADPRQYTQSDLARNIVADAVAKGRAVFAYDFSSHIIMGARKGYWRDVGTHDQYFQASQDALGPDAPIDFDGPWKIFTHPESEVPVKIDGRSDTLESRLARGVEVTRARIIRSTVAYNTILEEGVVLNHVHHFGQGRENALRFGPARIGHHSRLINTICDRNVFIPPYTVIGEDKEHDLVRGFTISPGGKTVVPRGYVFD